jgi:DNA polymerase V
MGMDSIDKQKARASDPFYSNGASARLSETTNDTGEVVALAVRLGERLWRDGFR